jgi:hypothetical protein
MILAHIWDAFGFPCKIGCDIHWPADALTPCHAAGPPQSASGMRAASCPTYLGLLPIILLHAVLPGLRCSAAVATRCAPCRPAVQSVVSSTRASISSPHLAGRGASWLSSPTPVGARPFLPLGRWRAPTLHRLPPNWVLFMQAINCLHQHFLISFEE